MSRVIFGSAQVCGAERESRDAGECDDAAHS
jgi:hypothetical protein